MISEICVEYDRNVFQCEWLWLKQYLMIYHLYPANRKVPFYFLFFWIFKYFSHVSFILFYFSLQQLALSSEMKWQNQRYSIDFDRKLIVFSLSTTYTLYYLQIICYFKRNLILDNDLSLKAMSTQVSNQN